MSVQTLNTLPHPRDVMTSLSWGAQRAVLGLYRRVRHNPYLARRVSTLRGRGLIDDATPPQLTDLGRAVARELKREA